jgi:hypothetical protein
MVVSDTGYIPAFRRRLASIGTPPQLLERIIAVDDRDLTRVGVAAERVRSVYISPICDMRVRQTIPRHVSEIRLTNMLSEESLEMLEAVVLFDAFGTTLSAARA